MVPGCKFWQWFFLAAQFFSAKGAKNAKLAKE